MGKTTIIRAVSILLLVCMTLCSVISCEVPVLPNNNNINTTGNGNNSSNNSNSNNNTPIDGDVPLGTAGLIYNSKTDLKLVLSDYEYYEVLAADLIYTIMDTLDDRVVIRFYDDEEVSDHEIVIGPSKREVSKEAYARLDSLMAEKSEEFGGYVLYSDGSSLALAYTKELTDRHLEDIMKYLADRVKKVSLVAKSGIVATNFYNIYDIYGEEDNVLREEAFETLAETTSKEVADAVRAFYAELYTVEGDSDMLSWLAKLYQPRSCICDNYVNGVRVCLHPIDADGRDLCSGGGFYYSNSARDTDGYLPDIESTNQALELFEKTGMLSKFGGRYENFISGQLRADIVAFTKGLQNPDGYFYHPQWTIEESRKNWSRVSRDLMWSVSILSSFGELPYYQTPAGELPGTGGRPKSASFLTTKLCENTIISVSRAVSASSSLPEHLQSIDKFKEYLSTKRLDLWGTGYGVANDLAAQVNQLVEANNRLGGDELKTVLFDWIEKTHRADNGLWTPTCYDALNAAFKIMMVYSAFRMPFPYAEAAIESAIEVLSTPYEVGDKNHPGHVCGAYNAWYDIAGLISNIRAYDSASKADMLQAKVIEIAPAAIRNTAELTAGFLCKDGSFSYFTDRTSVTSQGMPVAPAKIKEGDVNASIICSGGIIEHIGKALNVTLPPIYGTRDLVRFMDMIEKN